MKDIWDAYLTQFLERYQGSKLERARDLFEQVLQAAPPADAKPYYLQYADLEEKHGLAKRAMLVYERAARNVPIGEEATAFALTPRSCGPTLMSALLLGLQGSAFPCTSCMSARRKSSSAWPR